MSMCGKCYKEGEVFEAMCKEKPELLVDVPIGMYHCPNCGTMILAGMKHPKLCWECNTMERSEG